MDNGLPYGAFNEQYNTVNMQTALQQYSYGYLFEHVHSALEGLSDLDRCPVPPITYQSWLLSERPYVEYNVRRIYLGSIGCVDMTGNSKKIKIVLSNACYPEVNIRKKQDIDYNMMGYKGDEVTGEHFSITLNNKTIYTGILGVLYAMTAYTVNGRIKDQVSVRHILEYTLLNSNSTTLRGIPNYYSWISCANLRDISLQYIMEMLYNKIMQYQCEFFVRENNTLSILYYISELFR